MANSVCPYADFLCLAGIQLCTTLVLVLVLCTTLGILHRRRIQGWMSVPVVSPRIGLVAVGPHPEVLVQLIFSLCKVKDLILNIPLSTSPQI